jgi:uncharacterized YceG family protein
MTEDNDELDFGWVDGSEAEESPPAQPAATDDPPAEAERAFGTRRTAGVRRQRQARGTGAQPRRPTPRRIWVRRTIALITLAIVGFAAWFLVSLFQPFAGSGSGSLTVVIAEGEGTSQIGDELARRGVIDSSFFFGLRAALDGDRSKFRAGIFQMRRGMSYGAALSSLTAKPGVVEIDVTIPPGYTRTQIAARARALGLTGSYLAASVPAKTGFHPSAYGAPASVESLEGFLFPDTYFDYPHANAGALVSQQLAAFESTFDTLDFTHASAAGLNRYDVLIIASMIEREAALPGDRPLVAAVIYNRLKDRMPLGIDATLRYALGDYTKPLTTTQLALNSPYNTRLHRGLPPTPISNPGLASMQAAADPAHVSYLYYVDKPWTCGKLAFSTTYTQFESDVNAYNAARDANHGRAPTRCS